MLDFGVDMVLVQEIIVLSMILQANLTMSDDSEWKTHSLDSPVRQPCYLKRNPSDLQRRDSLV